MLGGCGRGGGHDGRVVIVGGGFAGATTARYLRRLAPRMAITLVEPNREYHCCPFSNAVIGGLVPASTLTRDYALLGQSGIDVVYDRAEEILHERRQVRLAGGGRIAFDRAVIAPGIRLRWGAPEGYDQAAAQRMPHAWRGGAQVARLQRALAAIADGGVVAISVPQAPFRCPPGPYERASLMGAWLHRHRPRSKILILDSNDSFSKQSLFTHAWETLYPGVIEWRPVSEDGAVRRVDPESLTLYTEIDQYAVAVANVIPPQAAGEIAERAGLTDATGWCPVDPASFESTRVPGIHVLGDACAAAPMPKSASAANSQAKLCALALAASFAGESAPPASLHNTCYSLCDVDYGISVSMTYRVADGGIVAVAGAGGVSPEDAPARQRQAEARYAQGWFESITADSFGA